MAERIRTIVTDAAGNIVADSGPMDPDFEDIGNGVAEGLEDLAVLARQTGRVAGKAQRVAKMISQVVGPLNRPLPEGPDQGRAK